MNRLMYATASPTGKIWSAVVPSWRSTPLTESRTVRACGSGISSAVTSHGPSGLKVSQFFPLSQVPPRSIWYSRSETSCAIVYPATCASPSSAVRRWRAVRPMTTPSSASQSVRVEPGGISTVSCGPTTVSGALRKRIGSLGIAAPVSRAWSW